MQHPKDVEHFKALVRASKPWWHRHRVATFLGCILPLFAFAFLLLFRGYTVWGVVCFALAVMASSFLPLFHMSKVGAFDERQARDEHDALIRKGEELGLHFEYRPGKWHCVGESVFRIFGPIFGGLRLAKGDYCLHCQGEISDDTSKSNLVELYGGDMPDQYTAENGDIRVNVDLQDVEKQMAALAKRQASLREAQQRKAAASGVPPFRTRFEAAPVPLEDEASMPSAEMDELAQLEKQSRG